MLTDATVTGTPSADRGAVLVAGNLLTWTGALAIGQSVVISYSVQINNPDQGGRTMINQVVSNELGSNCAAGSLAAACTTTVTVQVPALAIAITADTTTSTPGSSVGYTLVIRNTGETAYLGAGVTVGLAGVVDDGNFVAGTASIGSMQFTNPNAVWTGDLAIGATATVSYSVTVNNPDNGNRVLATAVSSAAPGSICTVAVPCLNTVTVLIPGLSVTTVSGPATTTPGGAVTFTTTLQNTGQTAYIETTFTSSLASVLDDASFDGVVHASVGVATFSAPNLTWTGSLPVGLTAVITYTVVVNQPDAGDRLLAATVVAPAAGSSCPTGSTNPSCRTTTSVLIQRSPLSPPPGAPPRLRAAPSDSPWWSPTRGRPTMPGSP